MDKNIHFVKSSDYYNDEFRIYDIAYLNNNLIISSDIIGELIYYELNEDLSSFNKKETKEIYPTTDLDNLISIFSIDVLSQNIILGSSKGEVVLLKDNKISDTFYFEKSKEISKVKFISENIISCGDFKGKVTLYDIRQKTPIKVFSEQSEEITDILFNENKSDFLLSSSIDSTLAVYDLKKNCLFALSDKLDEELNCLLSYNNSDYILCGSGEGNVLIFNWGWFGDFKDMIKGHNEGINDMVKYDENIFLTGSEDGLIRICTMHPKAIRGLIKSENNKKNNGSNRKNMIDVNKIKISEDKKSLITASGMDCLRLYNISYIEFSKMYKANNEFNSDEEKSINDKSEDEEKVQRKNKEKDIKDEEEEEDDEEEGGEIDDDNEEGDNEDNEEEEGEIDDDDEVDISNKKEKNKITNHSKYEEKEEDEGEDNNINKEESEKKEEKSFLNKKRKKSESESEEEKEKKEENDYSEDDSDSDDSISKKKKSKKVKKIGKKTKSLIAKEERKAFFNDL